MKASLKTTIKPLALALAFSALAAQPAFADDAELRARIDKLSAELESLKAEMKTMHSQTEAIASQQEAALTSTPVKASATAASPNVGQATLWGYGEINYTRPKNNGAETQADLRRAVVGVGYRFDENTRFMSEFEIEHAIASAEDDGEIEVEQFYIDHKLTNSVNLKAGLFLIPAGLLNESHEPTRYYGVERNFVESAIIPTTWREGGAAVYGSTEFGLAWDVGLTTGHDLGKWDADSEEGLESPMGAMHQELALAKAHDLSTYVALNYRGVPGFTVGSTLYTGKIAQGNPDLKLASNARLTFWDAHTRWTPGNFDLSAVYAKGTISDTKDLNEDFRINSIAINPTLVPKEFYGWYTQAAYKVWQSGTYALSPFVRYERINTASAYALPTGFDADTAPTETVMTYGVNFYLNPNVVLKADYQQFSEESDRDRYDLGLGIAF